MFDVEHRPAETAGPTLPTIWKIWVATVHGGGTALGLNFRDRYNRVYRYFVDWRRERNRFQPVFFDEVEDVMAIARRWLELSYPVLAGRATAYAFYTRLESYRMGMRKIVSWELWVEIELNAECGEAHAETRRGVGRGMNTTVADWNYEVERKRVTLGGHVRESGFVVCFRGQELRFARMDTEEPFCAVADESASTVFDSRPEALQAAVKCRLDLTQVTVANLETGTAVRIVN